MFFFSESVVVGLSFEKSSRFGIWFNKNAEKVENKKYEAIDKEERIHLNIYIFLNIQKS